MRSPFPRAACIVAVGCLSSGAADAGSLLSPNGPVAATQRMLLFEALGLMAIVVLPVFVLAGVFVWRFRASRDPKHYSPDWGYSLPLEIAIWAVPLAIVVAIGFLQVTRTAKLDPYKPAGPGQVLRIEAIALDWKWIFFYPEEGIATVDDLVVPAGQPFEVALTSDTVMNSFMIPGLGGQIYAMAGMETKMNLLADRPEEMWGRNMQFSGKGFPGQTFRVRAMTADDYAGWVAGVKGGSDTLDAAGYRDLREPSTERKPRTFATADPDIFRDVIESYGMADMRPDPQALTGGICGPTQTASR